MSDFALSRVGCWTPSLDFVPTSQARELAAELESLGFGAIWIPEVAGRDPFVQLTHILSATTTVIGATGIMNIYGRDAIAMSCGVRALTEAYPERVLLGIGVSHRNLVEDLRGHAYGKPVETMAAYLDAMDAAPYFAQRPTTPVRRVIAALGPRMLRLAAEKADGAHPYLVSVEHTATARQTMGSGPLLCPEQMFVLDSNSEIARATARAHLAVYLTQPNYLRNLRRLGFTEADIADGGSDLLVDSIVVWGDVDAIVTRVKAHLDAGADHVAVQALVDGKRPVPLEQWRELAPAIAEL